jgi:hypothetical protein
MKVWDASPVLLLLSPSLLLEQTTRRLKLAVLTYFVSESGDGDGNGEELDKDAIRALIEAIYDARADPTKKSQCSSMIS